MTAPALYRVTLLRSNTVGHVRLVVSRRQGLDLSSGEMTVRAVTWRMVRVLARALRVNGRRG